MSTARSLPTSLFAPQRAPPDALELLDVLECGLGKRREEALVIGLGKDVRALHRPDPMLCHGFRLTTCLAEA